MFYHFIKTGKTHPFRQKIIFVNPGKICGHMAPDLKTTLMAQTGFSSGAIVDGDWDLKISKLNFHEQEVYRSCYLHFVDSLEWEDTPLYQNHVERINRREAGDNSGLIKKLKDRYNELDLIYHQVFHQQNMSTKYEDLIKINISRDGSLIWGPDGRHRICIALILGLESIPASIGFIHTKVLKNFQALI